MSDGLHFRFRETAPDIRMFRLAEQELDLMRSLQGFALPCSVCVSESADRESRRRFHVRIDCEFGKPRGVIGVEAFGAGGIEALERAFQRMRYQAVPTNIAQAPSLVRASAPYGRPTLRAVGG